jgi:hypothetical protein
LAGAWSDAAVAQKFRKVDPRTWTDEKFRTLDSNGKLVALWMLTGSRVNRCGIVLWSPGLASEETGIAPNLIDSVCDTVCDTLFWFRDIPSHTVFLRRWWRYNRPDNVKALIGFLSDLHDVPTNGLREALIEAAQDLPSQFHTVYLKALAVGDTVSDTVSPQEKEKEKEKEKEMFNTDLSGQSNLSPRGLVSKPKKKRTRSKIEYDPAFERWWAVYPKKAGKEAAQREWLQARQRLAIRHPDWTDDQIRCHLGKQALAYANSHLGQHFPLDPERWLKRGRFDDDPSAWEELRGSGNHEPVDVPYQEH